MKRFEFKQRGLPLDIAGHEFVLPLTAETSEKLRTFGMAAQEQAKTLAGDPNGIEKAWALMTGSLDGLLGAGAAETIFAGRPHVLEDALDVMNFITEAVSESAEQIPQPVKLAPVAAPGTDNVQAALRIMQNPEVMQAISKAMQQ